MSDLGRYDPLPTTQEMFGAACKCFCQAKELLDSITPQTEEASSRFTFYQKSKNCSKHGNIILAQDQI